MNTSKSSWSLLGHRALVTGAGRGIGAAIVAELIDHGASVLGTARTQSDLDQLRADHPKAGDRLQIISADITQPEERTRLVAQAKQKLGGLDLLINNAGTSFRARAAESSVDDFRRLLDLNVLAAFDLARLAHSYLKAGPHSAIVNLSSVAGKEGNPGAPAYSATKAGVIALTKSLGKELAKYDIAVNCVTPAVAKTTLALSQDPKFLEMILSKIPRGRMLELTEAASMITWLASAENSFTTGATFDLSGGRATY